MHNALAVVGYIVGFAILTLVISVLPFLDNVVPFYVNVIVPIRPVMFMV